MSAAELLQDRDVLADGELLELGGWRAARRQGGVAVLPWRLSFVHAYQAGVSACATCDELGARRFRQAVVHLGESRDATWADLAAGWDHLDDGGTLLLCGSNNLGIRSAVKRLGRELEAGGDVVANRAHARVARFTKRGGPGPVAPALPRIAVSVPGMLGFELTVRPGVFSEHDLDHGTALLLEHLGSAPSAERVFDPGCGSGPLGLAAALRWPETRVVLADADARAVASARTNAEALGLSDRCEVIWWDALEDPPVTDCDLVLMNPPFHRGKRLDLGPPRAMFRAAAGALKRSGVALIVANRTLPYESELTTFGQVDRLADERGYKVLRLKKD